MRPNMRERTGEGRMREEKRERWRERKGERWRAADGWWRPTKGRGWVEG